MNRYRILFAIFAALAERGIPATDLEVRGGIWHAYTSTGWLPVPVLLTRRIA